MHNSGFIDYVAEDEVAKLSPTVRLAWAGAVCDPVVCLFSPQFRDGYFQGRILDLVWRVVCGYSIVKERDMLLRQLGVLGDAGAGEKYGIDPFAAGYFLLQASKSLSECHCVASVSHCSMLLGAHQLYRQGLSPSDAVVPDDYFYLLCEPVYRRARLLFDLLCSQSPDMIDRRELLHVPLDLSLSRISSELLTQKSVPAPSDEAAYILQLYSYTR